jgi:acyl carrier protein
MTDTKSQVRSFIVENLFMGATGLEFSDADSFLEQHIIDSTGFLELVSFIEETFGFRVEDNEMIPECLDSLDNIDAYVARKLAP